MSVQTKLSPMEHFAWSSLVNSWRHSLVLSMRGWEEAFPVENSFPFVFTTKKCYFKAKTWTIFSNFPQHWSFSLGSQKLPVLSWSCSVLQRWYEQRKPVSGLNARGAQALLKPSILYCRIWKPDLWIFQQKARTHSVGKATTLWYPLVSTVLSILICKFLIVLKTISSFASFTDNLSERNVFFLMRGFNPVRVETPFISSRVQDEGRWVL